MVQGRGINASLNETGKKQAQLFYESYKDHPFEKAYVSKLVRTQETIQPFLEDGLEHEKLEGLDEISWGTQEGVEFTPETATLYQETVKRWRAGELNLGVSGGETPIEVMERQKPAIEHILSQPEKNVLICMHGRAMRILLSWTLNYSLSNMDSFHHANLGLYQLTWTGTSFRLDRFNDTAHLNGY